METTRHQIYLRRGDFDYLDSRYENTVSAIIRKLVADHVDEKRKRERPGKAEKVRL